MLLAAVAGGARWRDLTTPLVLVPGGGIF